MYLGTRFRATGALRAGLRMVRHKPCGQIFSIGIILSILASHYRWSRVHSKHRKVARSRILPPQQGKSGGVYKIGESGGLGMDPGYLASKADISSLTCRPSALVLERVSEVQISQNTLTNGTSAHFPRLL
jgi:hypothetical protein